MSEVKVLTWPQKVLAYIEEHPGCTNMEAADAIGLDRGNISKHTMRLVREERVERLAGEPRQQNNTPTYYFYSKGSAPKEAPFPLPTAPEVLPAETTWADKIVAFVKAHPGVTNQQIADGIGYPASSVSGTSAGLWRQGILERTDGPPGLTRGGRRIGRLMPLHYAPGALPEGATPKVRHAPVTRAAKVSEQEEREEETEEPEEETEEPTMEAVPDEEPQETPGVLSQRIPGDTPEKLALGPAPLDLEAAIRRSAALLAERILTLAVESIEARLAESMPLGPASKGLGDLYSTKPPETNGKPSVLVVGLLPQQQAILQSDFHQTVKFSFWKNGAIALLKQKAEHVDRILVAADFVSHASTEALNRHRSKTTLVRGGMGAMRDELAHIVTGG